MLIKGRHSHSHLIECGKEFACNAGDLGLISGSGRSPGEGNGNPLQYSCLENSTDRGAWQGTVCGVARGGHDLATTPPPPGCGRQNNDPSPSFPQRDAHVFSPGACEHFLLHGKGKALGLYMNVRSSADLEMCYPGGPGQPCEHAQLLSCVLPFATL